MKNLRKVLVFVLFAFVTVFAFGMKNVKAANALAYEADFVSDVSAFSYTQNKTFAVDSVNWMISTGQWNSNVFYLGCNSSHAAKGVLSDNTDATMLAIASAMGTNYTAGKHAYVMYTTQAFAGTTEITFAWDGNNNIFDLWLLTCVDGTWTINASVADAPKGTSAAGTIVASFDAAKDVEGIALFASPNGSTNKTLRLRSVTIMKEAAEDLPQLTAPVVSVAGKVASWEAVEGAVEYKVGLYASADATSATYEVETAETSYDFGKFMSNGTWYVKVKAVADDVTVLSSEYSTEEVSFVNADEVIECNPTEFLSFIDPTGTTFYQLTGTLKAFYTSYNESATNNYDSGYNNASFYLTDGTSKVIVYRISGNQGANLAVGDVVTVKGHLQAYNGINQIPQTDATYVNITPAAAVQFEALETKTSLKLTIENEEVSAVAIRFGMMMTVAQYEALVAANATFGVAVVKKATLGENDLAEVADEYAFVCATVVRVNANGEADEAGEYYQFAFVVNNVPSTDYAVELVAACYVVVNGEYFVAAEAVQSVQSVAQAYVNAEDTSAYANYLAYLNELAGN